MQGPVHKETGLTKQAGHPSTHLLIFFFVVFTWAARVTVTLSACAIARVTQADGLSFQLGLTRLLG